MVEVLANSCLFMTVADIEQQQHSIEVMFLFNGWITFFQALFSLHQLLRESLAAKCSTVYISES